MRLVFAFCALFLPIVAGAQEPVADSATEADAPRLRQNKLNFFRERVRELQLSVADDSEQRFALVERPLLQFDNPVSGITDGFVFLWTDGGRPTALMKSYYNTKRGSWGRTYISLAPRAIELRQQGRRTWEPKEPGVSFRRMDANQAPADSARGRLTQMRALAARFRVVDNWGLVDPTDWELRLLPAPLYRYQASDEEIVDGALFGYVLSSSPEALVLLEAHQTKDGLQWRYAVSRATRFGITIWLDGEKIGEFARLDAWPANGVYYHEPLPLPDYPFRREN